MNTSPRTRPRPAVETRQSVTPRSGTPPGRPLPLWYTLLLAAVLVAATLYGLFVEGAYRAPAGVRESLPATLRGQDVVTLLAALALVWGGIRARAGSLRGHIVWLAICLYVPYTYLMYVMTPYNDALLLYIAALGLGLFGFINGLVRLDAGAVAEAFDGLPRRGVAWFLIVVGGLFASLWLVSILAVWPGGIPDGLFTYDLPSIVHVLDLGIVLPLLILTGVLLLRGHPVAPVMATILLAKTFLLGLALLAMNAFVWRGGGAIEPSEPVIWTVIVLVTTGWLVAVMRGFRVPSGSWLRPGFWASSPAPDA